MSHIAEISHRPNKKAKVVFKYDTDSNTYIHNEHGPLRADLLNTMGDMLAVADIDFHFSTIADLEEWLSNFVYIPLSATDKASIVKFKKKSIRALKKIIVKNQEYTNWTRNIPKPETNDFDFDFDDTNDFNFGEDPVDEQQVNEPETKTNKIDELDLKIEGLLIDSARSLESLCISLAGLCRLVVEQHKQKPSEQE